MKGILTTLLVVAFFASPLAAQDLTGTLQQIKKTGKIRIGHRYSQTPMSFLGKDGKAAGFSIDICRHIVNEVKIRIGSEIDVEYVPVEAKDRFVALSENKIDILCGTAGKTLSRSEIVDFTQLTFVTGASFMGLKGKKNWNNFEGKKVGVVKGTTTAVTLKELFLDTSIAAEIILLNTTGEGLIALEKEEIDAICADQVVLIGLAQATGDPDKFSILPDLFSYEPIALAVRRNDADFRLVADRVISHLYRTKQIFKIYDKWFSTFSAQRPAAFNSLVQLFAIPE
jgi:ABC-type amino acid transport substrate-binding protein